MSVKFDFGNGRVREVQTFDDLKEKGILVTNIRSNDGGSILCVYLNNKKELKYSQEAWGDKIYYAIPLAWIEVNTFTGQETPGRRFNVQGLSPEVIHKLSEAYYAHMSTKHGLHSYHDYIDSIGMIVVSEWYSIGD